VELAGLKLAAFAAAWALIGAAVALLLDEEYDYHKVGRGYLKLSDIFKASHELAIVVCSSIGGVLLWWSLG